MANPYFHKKLEHSGTNHYRPDIDGLRAIAVLFVVAFHAFPLVVRGGFVGVDVFFVISGYLITKIILIEFENRRFSFVNFYSRRIKRIFPALLLVLLFCFGIGWIALLADEFKQLGKHIFGGAVFFLNNAMDLDSAVAIRSMVIGKNKVSFQAGAGIVVDSNPTKEHQECLLKTSSQINAIKAVQ